MMESSVNSSKVVEGKKFKVGNEFQTFESKGWRKREEGERERE